MRKFGFLLFFISIISLSAHEDGLLSPPPAIFSHKDLQPSRVNIITGEYCDDAVDFILAGSEPLSIRRFYNHRGHKNQAYGHWNINPETVMLFNFTSNKHPRFAGIGDENGSFTLCEKEQGNTFVFDPVKNTSFTNTGLYHPLNTRFTVNKVTPGRHEHYWEGVIENGSGDKKVYRSEIGMWDHYANNDPIYQARIREERKPNGNIIYYEYEDFNRKTLGHSLLSTYYILRSISAYSAKGVFLGSINLDYPDRVKGNKEKSKRYIERVEICGSDKRVATYHNHIREVQRKKKVRKWGNSSERPEILDVVLDRVETPWKPLQNYNYIWKSAKYYFEHPYLFYSAQPEERVLEIIYDMGSEKVAALNAPVGPNGEMVPIARYDYQTDHTIVYDGENQKTISRFNEEKRIVAVEQYDNEQLIEVERSEWNPSTGNLIRKTIEDGAGHSLYIKEYVYDKNQNVIEERTGDGKKGDTICRTFSKDDFNLKLTESDRPGKCIYYTYVPNTNLLSSEIVYVHDQIVKRTFHFYDEEIPSACVKTIVDDGHATAPYDLSGITYRKILEIDPKKTVPCVGLPLEVREKTVDASGNEILLKKIRYTYHPSGKIEREDHYDATNTYRYSIINEYDDRERVIATTDPLGNHTTYQYDANFNPIAKEGPLSSTKWDYDKANRLIKTEEEGLLTQKQYDRANRVIATIDVCGNETRYIYDGLGRVTAIYHPDGGVEQKEYDALGNVTKEIDPNRYAIRKEYNFRGQPTSIYYPDGSEEHFTYNVNSGTLASHIDRNGTQIAYTYDILDNCIQVQSLDKLTTAIYSPFNKLSETDAEGMTTFYEYDLAGRKIAERKADCLILYSYDALGRLNRTQKGDTVYIQEYDLLDRVIERRTEDQEGNIYFQQRYVYDANGNQTHIITCEGVTETIYNAHNQPIQIITAGGYSTTIEYDYNGIFTKTTTNPKGVQKIEVHDACRRLKDILVKNPQGKTIQHRAFEYDPGSNKIHSIEYVYEGTHLRETIIHKWVYGPNRRIEKIIEAGEKVTQYFYDDAGRLKTTVKPDKAEVHREYDACGRLSCYYGAGIDYRYTYDCKDRLLKVVDSILESTTHRAYDAYDNVIEEKLASGLTIQSNYDPFGRRTELYLPDDSTVTYTYHGPYLYSVSRKGYTHTYSERNRAGKPKLITLPNNGETLSITWDPLLRRKHFDSSHYKADYAYDSVGNLIEQSYTDPLGSVKNTYEYDDLNQLVSENEHDYLYDSLYNRTAKDKAAYVLNPLCQVTHDGQKEYVYDKNGNLISDGEATYEFDILDRLIAVTRKNSRTTYTYDAFNRRISKNEALYIWDDKNEIGKSHRGKVCELRILGEGLGAEIGSAVFIEIERMTYFPIHDIQGSLAIMLNTKGNPCDTYRYTTFGEQLTEAVSSPWRFASKRYDEETGFIYFGRRYYAPNLGRWITADPQGFNDGPNLYAYVKNSPLLAFDLHGLEERNGAWARGQGHYRATFDYFYDGFCYFGPWLSSRIKMGYQMQWSLLSDPVGHGKWMYRQTRGFVRQIPEQMNWNSFKNQSKELAASQFPKTAKYLGHCKQKRDDYTKAYEQHQSSLEIATTVISLLFAWETAAEKNLAFKNCGQAEKFLFSKENTTNLYRAVSELEFK